MNIIVEEYTQINKKCKMFKYRNNKFKIKIYKNTYLLKDCIVSGIFDNGIFDNSDSWSVPVNLYITEYFKNEGE